MSLLQDALDKAKDPERKVPLTIKAAAVSQEAPPVPKTPVKPEIEHEPRLDSIKFYETLDKKVEKGIEALRPVKTAKVLTLPPAEPFKKVSQVQELPENKTAEQKKTQSWEKLEEMKPIQIGSHRTPSVFFKAAGQTLLILGGLILLSLLGKQFLMKQPAVIRIETQTNPLPSVVKPVETKVIPVETTTASIPSVAEKKPKPKKAQLSSVTPNGLVKIRSFNPAKPSTRVRFVLTGITSYMDGSSFALINNQAVGVGDRLRESAIVKSIGSDSVMLDFEGQEIRLLL